MIYDWCMYPNQYGIDMDCSECYQGRIAELEAERELIAEYLLEDPPFDVCAGIDLHERASLYDAELSDEGPTATAYYKAFLDCCRKALQPPKGDNV